MKVVNWVPAFGWEIVFELVGVLCWVGTGMTFLAAYGTLREFGPAVVGAAFWSGGGGLLFFMGHVIRLLIEIEGKTSR